MEVGFRGSLEDKYEGEYKDNLKHGQGVLSHFRGSTYKGEWKDGKEWNGRTTFPPSSLGINTWWTWINGKTL